MNHIETIVLSHLNTSLLLEGTQDRRNINIHKVIVQEGNPDNIKLTVLDEKDIPVFSEILTAINDSDNREIAVHKKFVFYDHLTVTLASTSSEEPFAVAVVFE
ncbi:hypothetical protein ACFSKU_02665 [Pontibacter silvestris]|uniref:Uncharacterized protein n=1 Tax=Pontibacter silvestris TaxID=2305183 RepID=A0ABW4WVB6_9BACT|nr:hypothetical protein [Pontibacter silvestris]MCC9137702.1 hypothetical protein [Pontibacter silvestris]